MSNKSKVAIGIDLGSSKCCVGVVRDGKVEIIENERGNKTTPSYVAFTDTERLIGEDAKDQATLNPTNTVFGVKRIMGRKGDDPIVKSYADKVPFVVTTFEQPVINVTYKEREEFLLPQQISAMLLTKMKEMAETHLGCEVHDAVISVPACFTNAQRQATKDAAQIAGLNVLRLINEPTAAAIAYEANRRTDAAETVVVVDFGGGKLDVSVIEVTNRKINVRAVAGLVDFGGSDIDAIVKAHLISRLKIVKDRNISEKASEIMKLASDQLKQSLSLIPAAQLTVDCFSHEGDVISLTKDEFKNLIQVQLESNLRKCLVTVLKVLGCIREVFERIKVILVGGSTRIPLVQKSLRDFFSKKQLDQSINPDEAVAYGAALQAALLGGDNRVEDVEVNHVVPYGFGVNSEMVIPLYAPLPQTVNIAPSILHLKGVHDITIHMLEDVGYISRKLDLWKEFGRATLILSHLNLTLDENGIFDVKAVLAPNHLFENVGGNDWENLDAMDMDEMSKKEQQFRKDTTRERNRVSAMTDLEACCLGLKKRVESNKMTDPEQLLFSYIAQKCSEYLDWLDSTKMAKKCEYEERKALIVSLEDCVNQIEEHIQNESKRIQRKDERQLKQEQRQMKQNVEMKSDLDHVVKIETAVETDTIVNEESCMNEEDEKIIPDSDDADKVETNKTKHEAHCNSVASSVDNDADKSSHIREVQHDEGEPRLQPDAVTAASGESRGLAQPRVNEAVKAVEQPQGGGDDSLGYHVVDKLECAAKV